jgi:hypothetical protein
MNGRIKKLGIVLALFGFAFIAAGGYAFIRTQDGAKSLQAFSAVQNVKLTYNDQGQLTDHGDAAGGQAILSLLQNDWGYKVDTSELNPNDPVVNTASEYMVQMATIAHHTLDSTQTVVLDKDVTAADGTVFKAGTYSFNVDGRYFSAFNRSNPIEAKARDQAWSALAHGLIAELGVGSVTASTLQLGLGLAALFAGLGLVLVVAGVGLVWAVRPETVTVPAFRPVAQPA